MIRKHFTEDFRKEVVRFALNSDFFRHQVADDLGLDIQHWTSKYQLIVFVGASQTIQYHPTP